MARRLRGKTGTQGGFTMIEVMLVLLIISLLATIAVPYLSKALRSGHRASMVADSRELYSAFMRYRLDSGAFPSIFAPPETAFNTQTLAPLSTGGYYSGVTSLLNKLWRDRIPIYIALSVESANDQFWTLMRSKKYRDMWILVAHTDRLPFFAHGGGWMDGVYILYQGRFVKVDEAR
jgi:prepilin-type N-terminal cleavage/methylation domain-containing protein